MSTVARASAHGADGVESAYAWTRLLTCLAASTIGGVGMWSGVVALPALQAEFGGGRAEASLPYTALMIGIMAGGILWGRIADRFGVAVTVAGGALAIGAGYALASVATSLWQFTLAQAVLIGGLGAAASFGPLIADVSHWFIRRRGIAVAIGSSGSYLAGTVWPPIVQHLIDGHGWRQTHLGIGLFCVVTMLPLALLLRRRPPVHDAVAAETIARRAAAQIDLSPRTVQALLVLAGLACCVAMSMPQVHIVAYCVGLGYAPARGAEMLSVMLGCGILSRLATGLVADRIGGLRTLLIGSGLQLLALMLYMPFDALVSLYLIAALFGLSQGGIVPSYALIVRDVFPPSEAGQRIGLVLAATLAGMAVGGWMSGKIFDLTGSYQAAFANGIAWNLLNLGIAYLLFYRGGRSSRPAPA